MPTLEPLSDLEVVEGSPARFVTSLAGAPAPVISWFREGVFIKPSRDFQVCAAVTGLLSQCLFIDHSSNNHVPLYICSLLFFAALALTHSLRNASDGSGQRILLASHSSNIPRRLGRLCLPS